MLRKLANHSLKTFRDEVKAGKRRELSKDELHEDPVDTQEPEAKPPLSKKPAEDDGSASDGDDDGESKGKKSKRDKSWKKHSGVKQAKLVRMQERIDPVTLKGKSKGYGFLEMYKHADSLRVLRWANNNVDVGPLFEKWWKDDLEMMVKSETDKVKTMKKGGKGDEEVEQAESRLSKMKAELEAGAVRKAGKGSLIVEFSIENVQVVQRRTTRDEVRVWVFVSFATFMVKLTLLASIYPELEEKTAQRRSGGGTSVQEDQAVKNKTGSRYYQGTGEEAGVSPAGESSRVDDWEKTEAATG